MSVKVLDVNLSDKNSSLKDYGTTFDDAFIIGNQGKIKSAFGTYLPTLPCRTISTRSSNDGSLNPSNPTPPPV